MRRLRARLRRSKRLAASCSSDSCEFWLQLNIGAALREIRYVGEAFSSGGYDCPVWSGPQVNDANPDYSDAAWALCPDQDGGGEGCSENGPVSEDLGFNGEPSAASWYAWSDGANVCGSNGAYWELSRVMVR